MIAIKSLTWLDRDFSRNDPRFGFSANWLTFLVGCFAFLVEELHLNARNRAEHNFELYNPIWTDSRRTCNPRKGITLGCIPSLKFFHPKLKFGEVQRASVVRTEGVLNDLWRDLIVFRKELNLCKHGIGYNLNDKLHAKRAINRFNTYIREPAGGVDRLQINFELIPGDATTRANGHGVISSQFHPLLLRVTKDPIDHHLCDQHSWLR